MVGGYVGDNGDIRAHIHGHQLERGQLQHHHVVRLHVGGNIGKPLLAETPNMEPDDMVVLELSSFQLMTMDMSPDIALSLIHI